MNKALKITLYFVGSTMVLLFIALIFHNIIISYTLKSVISDNSEGKVSLQLRSVDLDLRTLSIIINKPELSLNEVYLDESNNMQIERVIFEKVEIDKADLRKLIFDGNIKAEKLFIDKPEFLFTELGKKVKSGFQPEKLLAILNQDSNIFGSLQIDIDRVEIHYGSIKILEQKSPGLERDVADFTFVLNRFNTQSADSKQKRILFSEEVSFKLKKLSRKLESGYILKIDSAIFNSTKSTLQLEGASLNPAIENSDNEKVSLQVGQLFFTNIGWQEVQGLEELTIQTIKLSDGNLILYQNRKTKKQANSDKSKGVEQLKKIFKEFKLDSLVINRFAFQSIVNGSDTSITARDIHFMITGVQIDSGMFDNPFKKFIYDSIRFGTANLVLDKLVPGFHVQYKKMNYSNSDRRLIISAIHIVKDSAEDGLRIMDISLREINIDGFSFKRFQKQLKQRLSVNLVDPDISFSFNRKNPQNENSRKLAFPGDLELKEVIMQNGNINIKNHDNSEIIISGLDVKMEDFCFPDKTNNEFRYQNLDFKLQSLFTQNVGYKSQFSMGPLIYKDQLLVLRKIYGSLYLNNKDYLLLSSDSLITSKFNLESLIFNKQLNFEKLSVFKPVITGVIENKQDSKQLKYNVEWQNRMIPVTINMGGVDIKNGLVNASIDLNAENLNLSTNYKIRIGAIETNKGDSINSILRQLLWDIQFNESVVKYQDHDLFLESLETNSFESTFGLDNLSVSSKLKPESNPDKLVVKNFHLPTLKFTGLDYKLLLNYDSLYFCNLMLDGLTLDVILPASKKNDRINSDLNEKIDPRKFMFFGYDSISLARMHVNIEKRSDSSHQVFQLENLHFGYKRKESNGLNLINNIGFEFESFYFTDTISNKYLKIEKGFADPVKMSFIIQNVEGSNMSQKDESSEQAISSMNFSSSQIVFDEIFIKEKLPSRIKVGKLSVGDMNLNISSVEKETNKSRKGDYFKVNLELLKRFTNIITRFQVESTDLNDFSLIYRSNSDTITKAFTADSIAFIVDDIDIDTAMIGKPYPQIIKKMSVDFLGKSHITSDSLYEIKTGRLHYDFLNNQISFDSLYITPRYCDSVFFKKSIYQTDRLKLFGEKLEINNFNLDALLDKGIIHLGSIQLYDFDVDMFRDKRFPRNPDVKPPLPREALMNIDQKFLIDSILVKNSILTYKELDFKSKYPGEITFSNIKLNGYQLTNILNENDKSTAFKVNINAKFMKETDIDFSIFFPLYPDTTAFWLKGKTDEIDLVNANSMTENLLGIGITRGKGIVDIPFLSATDSIASGTVHFRYKKLKLALYSRKKEELDRGFFSPLANLIINDLVRSNKPRFTQKPVVGISYFRRDTQKGVINYAWKSIMTGIISSLGINNKNQRKERKIMNKAPEKANNKKEISMTNQNK